MLYLDLKPLNDATIEKETWENYRSRLRLPQDEATLQFYRQVPYDHFDHFNEHYPDFELSLYTIKAEMLTAREAYEQIRYLNNQPMDSWNWQYGKFATTFSDYIIYKRMSQDLTFPFPPVLIDATFLKDNGWRVYGRPLHLVEGTHRTSYLRHMLEKQIIAPESLHKFVVLRRPASNT